MRVEYRAVLALWARRADGILPCCRFEDALRICVKGHDCLTTGASQGEGQLIAVLLIRRGDAGNDDISHLSRRTLSQPFIWHGEANASPCGGVEDDIDQ